MGRKKILQAARGEDGRHISFKNYDVCLVEQDEEKTLVNLVKMLGDQERMHNC